MQAKLRRMVRAGVVSLLLLSLLATAGCSLGGQPQPDPDKIPARVQNAEEVAERAVPGWKRAREQGLVVDLGQSYPVAGSDATIRLEKAWYSGREAYILYTVTVPRGGTYVMPTALHLGSDRDETDYSFPAVAPWSDLSTWGGFSPEGFHSLFIISGLDVPEGTQQITATLKDWRAVTPNRGLDEDLTHPTDQVYFTLPWDDAYLKEPAPESIPLDHEKTWLGRTLRLKELRVGTGWTWLTGEITLGEGEDDPSLDAFLISGGRELGAKIEYEPTGEPGRYTFTAAFDGLDEWPAPVSLYLQGIRFGTHQTLEWRIPWAKYRDVDSSLDRLMDPEDQVSVPFYGSEIVSVRADDWGISFEERVPKQNPPYVEPHLQGHGRGEPGWPGFPDMPGFEVINDAGEVVRNMGGGGGAMYYTRFGRHESVSISLYEEYLPKGFLQSEQLLVRYVNPSGTMVIDETWQLTDGE